jgi:Fe-Mn family superoxide dismutase
VNNVNTIIDKLEAIRLASSINTHVQEFSELHRRLGWEFNGMRLHEIFFSSLKIKKNPVGDEFVNALSLLPVYTLIEQSYGTYDAWLDDFCNIAKMRGFGWTMLTQDEQTGKVINTWVNEHDGGVLVGCKILLCVDMLEHAYIRDFGTNRQMYLETIFAHLDWESVNARV